MAREVFSGDGGIRTLDLCVANAALSQLSYTPILLHDTYQLSLNISMKNKIEKQHSFVWILANRTSSQTVTLSSEILEKSGDSGARTHDLSRVRRTLIPAELYLQQPLRRPVISIIADKK